MNLFENYYPIVRRWSGRLAMSVALPLAMVACGGGGGVGNLFGDQTSAHLYTQTNETANAVVHFVRKPDGSLSQQEKTATGGVGSNAVKFGGSSPEPDSLASQNSVIISPDNRMLFAVNAGDSSVSSLSIDSKTGVLTLLKKTQTDGVFPNSLAYNNGVLYVSFTGGGNQLAAFKVSDDGSLGLMGNYSLATSGLSNLAPTQMVVDPAAKFLLVTAGVKANAVVSMPINSDGTLGSPVNNPLVLAEIPAGSPADSTFGPSAGMFARVLAGVDVYFATSVGSMGLYSYSYNKDAGVLTQLGRASSGIKDPRWLAITPAHNFAFVGNSAGPISSYNVDVNGQLSLVSADATTGVTQGFAGDSWISGDGKYLYSNDYKNSRLVAYGIGSNGSLTKINQSDVTTATGLSLQGMAGI